MTLGEVVRQKRTERCLTQKRLAEILGVNPATISNCEKEVHATNILFVEYMADYFKCSVDELCGREPVKISISDIYIDVINDIEKRLSKCYCSDRVFADFVDANIKELKEKHGG